MSIIKKLALAAFSIATLLFVIPFFAVLGLAMVGITLVVGLIGSVMLHYKAKQVHQSGYAKAYAEQESHYFK